VDELGGFESLSEPPEDFWWTTSTGCRIKPKRMTDGHLRNSLEMMQRRAKVANKHPSQITDRYAPMLEEFKRREEVQGQRVR